MKFLQFQSCLILFAISTLASYSIADEVTLISVPGYPTGANINALAGPLFSSSLDSVDITSGSATAMAAKDGNFATHLSTVELDYSGGELAFFESVYGSPFSRTAALDHRASAESIYHFSVDVPTMFTVEGFFGVTDDPGTTIPGNVEFEIELLEFDSMGAPLGSVFYNYQVSKSTTDSLFFVGGMDGDTTNVLEGDFTGILDPSSLYRFRTLVTTNAIDFEGDLTDGGATAFGEHTITFATAAVPEPTSLGMVILASAFPFIRRKRNTV